MKLGTIIITAIACMLSACSGLDFHAGFNVVDEVKTEKVTKDRSLLNRFSRAWDKMTGQEEEGVK